MVTSKKGDIGARVAAARSSARKHENAQQLDEFKKGQITLWDQDDKRGIPNAFARAPIFNVTGRGKRREVYTASNKLIFKLPGQGEIGVRGAMEQKTDLSHSTRIKPTNPACD